MSAGAVSFGADALADSYAVLARAMSTICASRSTSPTNVRPPCSKVPSLNVTAAPPACARRPAEAITATAAATTSATNVRLTPICSSLARGPEGPPLRLRVLLLGLQLRRRRLGELRCGDRDVWLNLLELERHLHVGLRQRPRERDLHAEPRQFPIIGVVELRRDEG